MVKCTIELDMVRGFLDHDIISLRVDFYIRYFYLPVPQLHPYSYTHTNTDIHHTHTHTHTWQNTLSTACRQSPAPPALHT